MTNVPAEMVEKACVAYYDEPAWKFMSHKAGCKERMTAALHAIGLPELLAENAAMQEDIAEYQSNLDAETNARIEAEAKHAALVARVEGAPVAITNGYEVWTVDDMPELPDMRAKVRVRLLAEQDLGDGDA